MYFKRYTISDSDFFRDQSIHKNINKELKDALFCQTLKSKITDEIIIYAFYDNDKVGNVDKKIAVISESELAEMIKKSGEALVNSLFNRGE